jgi:ADP-ribosylglycohydrolase
LGEDTFTTGGLAGLLYGYDAIPKSWIIPILKKEQIDELVYKLKD